MTKVQHMRALQSRCVCFLVSVYVHMSDLVNNGEWSDCAPEVFTETKETVIWKQLGMGAMFKQSFRVIKTASSITSRVSGPLLCG